MPNETSSKKPAREEPVVPTTFLGQVNDLFQKNAKVSIVVASALIIVCIFLIASHFWKRVRLDRGLGEVEMADRATELETLKPKYKDTPEIYARILYRLGSAYYSDGELDKAREAFQEFSREFKGHALSGNVERALLSIDRDLEFMDKDKAGLVAEHRLWVHPELSKSRPGQKMPYGPLSEPSPLMDIELGRGHMSVDLYPDDAPKAVKACIDLLDKGYFKDFKFVKRADGKGWQIEEPKASPNKDEIDFEATGLPVVKGTIALVRKDADPKNFAARFQIFTEDAPELQGQVTVIGQVSGRIDLLANFPADETLKTAKVLKRSNVSVDFPDEHGHSHDHDHDH